MKRAALPLLCAMLAVALAYVLWTSAAQRERAGEAAEAAAAQHLAAVDSLLDRLALEQESTRLAEAMADEALERARVSRAEAEYAARLAHVAASRGRDARVVYRETVPVAARDTLCDTALQLTEEEAVAERERADAATARADDERAYAEALESVVVRKDVEIATLSATIPQFEAAVDDLNLAITDVRADNDALRRKARSLSLQRTGLAIVGVAAVVCLTTSACK